MVATDLKKNVGLVKDKKMTNWAKPHGTCVEFLIDGKVQLNGEGGVLNYLRGNVLLNPHLTLRYKLPDAKEVVIEQLLQ